MPPRQPSLFVGRTHEVGRLRSLFDEATTGAPRVALVVGDPGVGKSRLVAEVLSELGSQGPGQPLTVLQGRSTPISGASLPYAPFVVALRTLLSPAAGIRTSSSDVRPSPLVQWPALRALSPLTADGPEAQSSRLALFESVLALLREASDDAPVVLVLDDLQWADPSTVDLLGYLAHNLVHERILLLLGLRTTASAQDPLVQATLAEIERLPIVVRVAVPPLDQSALATLVEAILGRPVTFQEVGDVVRRTGGVPFLVEELLAQPDPGDPATADVSDTARHLIRSELHRLPTTCRDTLGVAAVAGTGASTELLARASGLSVEEIHARLRAAFGQGLLVPADEAEAVTFRHDLLREVTAEEVLPAERRRLHGVIAEVLASRPDLAIGHVDGELAFHQEQAGNLRGAVVASLRAATRARSHAAPGDVARHLERVLLLWEDVPDAEDLAARSRAALAAEVAGCRWTLGDPVGATRWAAEALAGMDPIDDPDAYALTAANLGLYRFTHGAADAVEVVQAAVDTTRGMPGTGPGRAACLSLLATLQLLSSRVEDALGTCEQAASATESADVRVVELHTSCTRGCVLHTLGQVRDGSEMFEQVIADLSDGIAAGELASGSDGEVTDARVVLARTIDCYAFGLIAHGWVQQGRSVAERGLREVRHHQLGLGHRAHLVGQLALALVCGGEVVRAQELLDDMPRVAPSRFSTTSIEARVMIHLLQGDLDTADWLLQGAGFEEDLLSPLPALGVELSVRRGDLDEAVRRAQEFLGRLAERRIVFHGVRIAALGVEAAAEAHRRATLDGSNAALVGAAAQVEVFLDEVQRMSACYDPAEELPPEPAAWRALAAAYAADAVHGPHAAEALGAWRCADEIIAGTDLQLLRLRSGLGLSTSLLASGDRAGAVRVITVTRDLAERVGANAELDRLDELVRRARLDLGGEREARSAPTADRFGITEREVEVLGCLADNLTNREIADRLFISPKTASVHVSNVLRKLDVPNRRAAAAEARRLGLLPA